MLLIEPEQAKTVFEKQPLMQEPEEFPPVLVQEVVEEKESCDGG